MIRLTKGQFWKFLATVATIVGTITAIASLSTLNLTVAEITGALIALLSIAVAISYFVTKDDGTARDLTERELKILTIRPVIDEIELRIVADLDEEEYGEHTVDFQGLQDWWKRYPKGAYGMFFNRKLIGAIGIWPLTKNAYERLTSGKLVESMLIKTDISTTAKNNEHTYWYFGGIILAKKHRKQPLAKYASPELMKARKFSHETLGTYFLHIVLKTWMEEAKLAPTIRFCGLAATPMGARLLEHFGFEKAHVQSPDKLNIYIRVAPREELRHDLEVRWGPSAS